MVEKAKFFYFTVFVFVVFALVFHITAMGHHHWKRAEARNATYGNLYGFNTTMIGLFTRCISVNDTLNIEQCFPNRFPMNYNCDSLSDCLAKTPNETCRCDFLPSTKGIASCAIIASVFLGLALIILFIHSIKTSETRSLGLILGLLPFIFLLFAWMFILTTLILVGSYLSRDIMHVVSKPPNNLDNSIQTLRELANEAYLIRVGWATGLEIIAIFFSFVSMVFYGVFLFKYGRSS